MKIRKFTLPLALILSTAMPLEQAFATSETPLVPVANPAPLPSYMKGVNLSGYEYNPGPDGDEGVPCGQGGCQKLWWTYVIPTTAEMDYYKGNGFSIIRLPFDISRLQPINFGLLNQTNLGPIVTLVEHARAIGMYVILDPHDYGQMWCTANADFEVIGYTACATNSAFADFWSRLSMLFQNYPNVIYGLMNEPYIQTAAQWETSALAAINAIRSITTTQTILIPGTAWTGAWTWTSSGNGAAWAGYKDPAGGPFMFEMHQYLDPYGSGTQNFCVVGAGSRLSQGAGWLATNGYKGFLGEFDWGNVNGVIPAQCVIEGNTLMAALGAPHWGGWTWWASGPWTGNTGSNLDPGADGIAGEQPQTAVLVKNIPLRANDARANDANDDETNTCREFTLGGIGQTSSGYAPNQRQQDSCRRRR
jgi:endoglucanase